MAPAQNPISSKQVAVIGAGASGLIAARELHREGHTVVVFEREKQVGGLWIYSPKAESDPLSLDPNRLIVHSSVYESLRTNLPRECMGFRDYPFVPREDDLSRDSRRYPSHREVLAYLQDFAREFKIEEMVRFETEVVRVEPVDGKWKVRSKTSGKLSNDEIFDAVVVCSGHYTEPYVATIPGINSWPGMQVHSHNYRVPGRFENEVVVVIGNFASGADIRPLLDVAKVAKEVHIASRGSEANTCEKLSVPTNNLWIHSESKYLDWVAEESGCLLVEPWRVQQVERGYKRLVSNPENYRDEWDDNDLIEEAYEDFSRKRLISSRPSYFPESGR
ncbi:unnamed protein product [Eruca vesicaria subsp. sativa]|uniref:Flavin-containing monooxygenase n=1 Tax=Eruca vesicaria subsp. sativa TaxID=29727 RepID=A0ABC8JW54_ERUVS|nr:unnamed protein product [Eruca vesicaria subsp. sativa]